MKPRRTQARRRRSRRRGGWLFALGFMLGVIAAVCSSSVWRRDARPVADYPSPTPAVPSPDSQTVDSSIDELIKLAESSLDRFRREVDDYTATLIKQESIQSVLGEPNEMLIKVQCKHRGGAIDESEPMRVYLRFLRPPGVAGREVIWAEDLHDGKLVAHEAGLMGMLTVRLDPTGMIAMRGQKYPISDIGLTNLMKKLIERGYQDRDDPDVTVVITRDVPVDDLRCDLIQVRRSVPSGREDDFSLAEICIDRELQVPIRYTAYGWPEPDAGGDSKLPLLESYTYLNIKTNVGLNESDFDPRNPEYQFR